MHPPPRRYNGCQRGTFGHSPGSLLREVIDRSRLSTSHRVDGTAQRHSLSRRPPSVVSGESLIELLPGRERVASCGDRGADRRLAELERRLGLNSSNSGPPSSDGLKKPPRVSRLRTDPYAAAGAARPAAAGGSNDRARAFSIPVLWALWPLAGHAHKTSALAL